MELKPYQASVIADLSKYLSFLVKKESCASAYSRFWNDKGVSVGFGGLPPYQDALNGVPNVCLKVPTGGGKTFIAASAIKPIFEALPFSKTKAVVWLVPSDAILEQTLKTLSNAHHPYRQKINVDFSHRVEVYSKSQLLNGQNFSPSTVNEQLSLFVLSYDSFRTSQKEGRKAYQENGNLAQFAKYFNDSSALLQDTDETALIQVIRSLNPVVIVDESHHAGTALSKKMLQDFYPSFVLDLTATPQKESNIIAYVDALQLKSAQMVKLPVIVYNRKDYSAVISDAIHIRDKLEAQAKADRAISGRYIRPIVLFQAEPKNKDSSTTFEKLKKSLVEAGIVESQIAIKTADKNELRGVDLLSEDCPIRYIITVNALKEGWDCPFAYVLATIANRSSAVDVEQILGRVLRLPHTQKNPSEALNISYAITSSADFQTTLDKVVKGLNNAGFSDKDCRMGPVDDFTQNSEEAEEFTPVQMPIEEEKEDFVLDIERIKAAVAEQNAARPILPNGEGDPLFSLALSQAASYEQEMEQSGELEREAAPLEVRSAMNVFRMNDRFVQEAAALRLPQFMIPMDLPSFFTNDTSTVLSREALSEGFTLQNKDTQIDFSAADAEIARVDIEEDGAQPKAWKLKGRDNQYFREWFGSLSSEKRIAQSKNLILAQLTKVNSINDKDLIAYIDRVVNGLSAEQVEELQQSPLSYCAKIKHKIDSLMDIHAEEKFGLWVEQDKISCVPNYALKSEISPLKYTATVAKSLYTSEEEMNGLEHEVVWELSSMKNIKWWHRNMSRSGFKINGYINAFPDIIAMTESGKILMIEPKGDHLENSESKRKAAVGKVWEHMAGREYRYYMVFKEKDLRHEGTVRFDKFLEILKGL